MPKTLIIIDMQPYFETANHEPTIQAILKQIAKAKRYKRPIILVEYAYYRLYSAKMNQLRTNQRIVDAVEDAGNWTLVQKKQDDGSIEIIDAALETDIDLSKCVVCGVNTRYCVRRTVEGLAEELPDSHFDVVAEACNCSSNANSIEVISEYANAQIKVA